MESTKINFSALPLVEILCEIEFADTEWDGTVFGSFYLRIKEDFRHKVQEPGESLVRFISSEKNRVVQLAPDFLVVNQLNPCHRFEEWEPEIYRLSNIYRELAKPKRITRLGLRYISKVDCSDDQVEMIDYFTAYPVLPKSIKHSYNSAMFRTEVPYFTGKHCIFITTSCSRHKYEKKGVPVLILDIYDILEDDLPVEEEEEALKREIRSSRENIICIFKELSTDKFKSLFKSEEFVW